MIEAEFHPLAFQTNLQLNEYFLDKHLNFVKSDLTPVEKWLSYVMKSRGSLLSSCFQSTILLMETDLLNSFEQSSFRLDNFLASVKQFTTDWICLSRLLAEIEHFQQTKLVSFIKLYMN